MESRATNQLDTIDAHERMKIRSAAARAPMIYPGPVGELISRELLDWEQFGYRLGGSQMIMRLVRHVMTFKKETG